MTTRKDLAFAKRLNKLLPGGNSGSKTLLLYMLTLFFSYLDCLVLYTVFDEAFVQSKWLGACVSFGVALVLNILPIIWARANINKYYGYCNHENPDNVIKICRTAYAILFTATAVLRLAYADMFGQTIHIFNELDAGAYENEKTITFKSIAVVTLLILEPLATSLLNYCLALRNNHLQELKNKLAAKNIRLMEQLAFIQAAIKTLPANEDYRDILYHHDRKMYSASNEVLDAYREKFEAEAHIQLAEHVGTAEGASSILA